MIRTNTRVAAVLFVSLLGCRPVWAQGVATASLAGTVRDTSGGVLPGVTVTSTQTGTGFTRTAVSDGAGRYTMPSLPVGPYKLEFALQGFRTFVQTGIVLEVDASPTMNAALAPWHPRRARARARYFRSPATARRTRSLCRTTVDL